MRVAFRRRQFAVDFDVKAPILPPDLDPRIVGEEVSTGGDATTAWSVEVDVAEPGGSILVAQVGTDDTRPVLLDSGIALAVAGTLTIRLPILPQVNDTVQRKVRLAWATLGGEVGTWSAWLTRPQTPIDGTHTGFLALTLPALLLSSTTPLRVGTLLSATPATFEGGVEPYDINTIIQTADDADGTGVADDAHVLGANIDVGLVGKHVRAKTTGVDDADTTVIAYSPWSEAAVYEPGSVEGLVVGAHRWLTTATDEYQFVISLTNLDAGSYTGFAGTLQVQWARKPASATGQPSWEIMSPWDYAEGTGAVVASGSSTEWRTNTTSTATTGNWVKPHLRMPVHRPPDEYNLLLRYSDDEGVSWSEIIDLDLNTKAPIFPWKVVVPTGTTSWRPMDITTAMAARGDGYYGIGHQYCRGLTGNGNRYYAAGDMNGIRRSDDGGRSWHFPKCAGLETPFFNAIQVDPINADIVLAWGHAAWMNAYGQFQYRCPGLWRTADGGASWKRVIDNTDCPSAHGNEHAQSTIWPDPSTASNAAAARRWYFLFHRQATGGQLWTSNDGGQTWSKVGAAISGTKFSRVWSYRYDGSRHYVCASNGLWVCTGTPSNDASWARIGGGLPAQECRTVAFNDRTLYASIFQTSSTSNRGVWKSTNGGTSWSQVCDEDIKDLAVDWLSSPHVVYARDFTKKRVFVSQDAGATFFNSGPATTTPGDSTVNTAAGTFEAFMVPNTSVAGVCVNHAVDSMCITTNKGSSWSYLDGNKGYCGINAQLGNVLARKHPTITGQLDMWAEDVGGLTVNGGLTWSNIVNSVTSRTNPTGQRYWGGSRASASAYITLRSGRKIMAVGGNSQLLFYQDAGKPTWIVGKFTGTGVDSPQFPNGNPTDASLTAGTDAQRDAAYAAMKERFITAQSVIGAIIEHPTIDNTIWAGNWYSSDGGVNWAKKSLRIIDIWPGTNKALFASGNTNLYTSTDWGGGNPTNVAFWTAPNSNFTVQVNNVCARVDPHDVNAVYTIGAGYDVVRVRNTGTAVSSATVTEYKLQAASKVPTTVFRISSIAVDPNVSGLFYAAIAWMGVPNLWRYQGSWTDITSNAPSYPLSGIDCHPVSGDLILATPLGFWCRRRPSTYPTGISSYYDTLPNPIKPLLDRAGEGSSGPSPVTIATLTNISTTQGTAATSNDTSKVSGGTAPYTYAISPTGQGVTVPNGVTTVAANAPVQSRIFTLTVTDADGQTATATRTVTVTAVSSGTTVVSSSPALVTAVKNAAANAVIELASGNYVDVDLSGQSKTNLTIRSQTWAGASSTWAHFNGTSNSGEAIKLKDSSGINFSHIRITGAKHQNRDLFSASSSTNCSLRRSIITGGGCQIPARKTRNFKLEYNTLKDCFVDYVRAYEDCDGLEIRRNDFQPHSTVWGHGLHVDFIQFACNQTNLLNNRGTWGCIIEDNRFVETAAKGPADDDVIQGILVLHESIYGRAGGGGASDMPSKAHKNFTIRRNWIEGMTATNGIGLNGVDGATIASNKLLGDGRLQFYGRMAKCRNITTTNTVAEFAIRIVEKASGQNDTLAEGTSSIASATVTANPATLPTGWLGLDVGHLATDPQP